MRFPLNQRVKIGYSFGQPTFYNTSHKGQDYQANYWNLYAPTKCTVTTFSDSGGGKWVNFSFGNTVVQCAHLSKYIKTGLVNEGEVVAVTGNSGIYTSGPHLHLQIKVNGQLVDPEKFDWEGGLMSAEFDTLKKLIEGVNAKVDKNFVALQNEYKQMIGEVKTAVNNIQPGALSAEDQASVSWLTKVLKAIFNK